MPVYADVPEGTKQWCLYRHFASGTPDMYSSVERTNKVNGRAKGLSFTFLMTVFFVSGQDSFSR
jgi:hypothetical protein